MAIYVNNKYRIKRNANQQSAMQYLIQDLKIFQSYSPILVLSAIIGYNNDAFVHIENNASDGVLMQFFTSRDYDIIDLIAYSHKGEQSILSSDEKYEIFESYANGGFDILLDKLGINLLEKDKNDRILILKKLYATLLTNEFKL